MSDRHGRRAWRLSVAAALPAAAGIGAVLGSAGAEGRAVTAGVLLGVTLGAGLGTLYGVVTGIGDTLRGQPLGRAHTVTVAVLATLVLVLTTVVAVMGG